MPSPAGGTSVAYRGFVRNDGSVIAWPTLLADHNDFLRTFYAKSDDFAARWRQWEPDGPVDFDPGAPDFAREAVKLFFEGVIA